MLLGEPSKKIILLAIFHMYIHIHPKCFVRRKRPEIDDLKKEKSGYEGEKYFNGNQKKI